MPQLAAAETRTLLEQVNWETFLELAEGRAGGLGRHDGSRLAMLWLETPGAGGAGYRMRLRGKQAVDLEVDARVALRDRQPLKTFQPPMKSTRILFAFVVASVLNAKADPVHVRV